MGTERLSRAQVAERAGVDLELLDRLVEAGVLTPGPDPEMPFVPGDVRRAQLVAACAEAGMPIDGVGTAIAAGALTLTTLDAPHYERWTGRAGTTYEALSAEVGVPVEVFLGMLEALGFPRPMPEDRPRRDELDLIPVLRLALSQGMPHEALARLFRVYGDGLRRITHTETQLWHDYVDVPIERAGGSQRDVLTAGIGFGEQVMPLIDAAVLGLYRRMQEHAWMEDLVEHVQIALEEAGVTERPVRPPAMCFVDLVGYTRLTEEHGDEAAADLATVMADVVQSSVVRLGGRAVKWLGDGVMFYFKEPARAVVAALDIVEATRPADLPPAHVGLHAGPVVIRDGDYFGRTVNWAARIASHASADQVLVTREVIERTDVTDVRFTSVGPVELKGIAQPVELFRAERPSIDG